LLAPADTPPDIIGRYNQVVNDILRTPKVREALTAQGLSARGGSPADLAQLIASDMARWAKVVKDAKIATTE
jgi:tripartite-type tricarboxylate transporter receptor subunit TctC